MPGDHPAAKYADQGVAGERVGHRRHRPDRQAPPAGRGCDDVHEHTGADRGDVQRPCPERSPPVQRQGDPETGEDQGGGVRYRCLEAGHDGQVTVGVDHPVLRGEAHRGCGRGQRAKSDGGIAKPDDRAIVRELRLDRLACPGVRRIGWGRRKRSVRNKGRCRGAIGQLTGCGGGRCLHRRFLPRTRSLFCRDWKDAS